MAKQEKNWFAIYFDSDKKLTVVNLRKMENKIIVSGEKCQVKIGKNWIDGRVIANEKTRALCQEKMDEYLDDLSEGKVLVCYNG